ncbi:hypothetical protein [Mangrovibacterium diazotrophicum]|uniref:Glycosyl hydrolase family 65 n=1 Tax=Mangrovibacterium diazotrophicum TaxID=1261403 RepID=A0A419WAY9_9BACT|nr:hypothetical protein [Mangrovibacterium diazotrophicum]RKD92613.1 hypothetical protein BC643_2988 [Mangrovibacterium diazotrophicum]
MIKIKTIKIAALALIFAAFGCAEKPVAKIDRHALVTRNNVTVEGFDSLASLSVGNGNFAFTTDLTGLQTFYDEYENGVPLGTQSNWGWHTNPNTENYQWSETLKYWDVQGREVPYRHQLKDNPRANAACNYFRENPQRLHLGMIGLKLTKADGTSAVIGDIKNARHELDMWTGKITSNFEFEGEPVTVETYCNQDQDQISAQIESPLIAKGQLAVQWKFPAAVAENTHAGYDFNSPGIHQSVLEENTGNQAKIHRQLDTDSYEVALNWTGDAELAEAEPHTFVLQPATGESLEVNCLFASELGNETVADFSATKANNEQKWPAFWQSGGAVDFSACSDPRAKELERRTVLSQYLIQIQSSGNLPPAETGLTYNSWYGKFHLEMHWWHIAHFAQWNRPEYMLEQMNYYNKIYDKSLQTAKDQGYKGVRWPKMIGPDGENSPSSVGSYLIWQQPHIIWFAEQMYRANPSEETINAFKRLVFATADFMADFPVWSEEQQQYNLEPPLIPAQEHWPRESTENPPFELAYWHWALTVANEWKERAGETKDDKWEDVRLKLAKPDQADGVYLGIQGATDSYTNMELMEDHPVVLGAYGILPAWDKIDPEVTRKTMHVIAERWDWPSTWGWDYPMAAMSAVRLGEPELALEFLLKDVQKNTYLKNGHNYQSERLRVYLPGNGGFLTTIAMMCAGWDGCTENNPGFPKDGKWDVKWEGLNPMF